VHRAVIKMYDPEGNLVVVPVLDVDHASRLVASGWKAAESYSAAKKRNYPVLSDVTFRGSVRFFTSRVRI
jgi:hypothetical protein